MALGNDQQGQNPFQVFAQVSALQAQHTAQAVEEIKGRLASCERKWAADHDVVTGILGKLETVQAAIKNQSALHEQRYNQFETRLTVLEMEQKRMPGTTEHEALGRRVGAVEDEQKSTRRANRIGEGVAAIVGAGLAVLADIIGLGGKP